jgi:hypothetical protein
MFLGVNRCGCVGLTTLPLSVSQLSRQCGILNISQPYRPPRHVTGIAFFFTCFFSSSVTMILLVTPNLADWLSWKWSVAQSVALYVLGNKTETLGHQFPAPEHARRSHYIDVGTRVCNGPACTTRPFWCADRGIWSSITTHYPVETSSICTDVITGFVPALAHSVANERYIGLCDLRFWRW